MQKVCDLVIYIIKSNSFIFFFRNYIKLLIFSTCCFSQTLCYSCISPNHDVRPWPGHQSLTQAPLSGPAPGGGLCLPLLGLLAPPLRLICLRRSYQGLLPLTTWLSGSSPSFVSCAFLQKSLKGAVLIIYNLQMTSKIHGRPQPGQMKTLHQQHGGCAAGQPCIRHKARRQQVLSRLPTVAQISRLL